MREVYKKKIIKLLKHADYKPVKVSELARALGIEQADYPEFKRAFDELHHAGHVVLGDGSVVGLAGLAGRIIGTFRANPRGFGFVTPLESAAHVDLFIPPGETMEAMTGDVVAAKVVEKSTRGEQIRYSGRIIEIVQRGRNRFVGTLMRKPEGWLVQPDGSGATDPITVDDVTAKNAKEKDKVVIEILSYPTERRLARGVIVEVLGKAGRYESEIASIAHQFQLPGEFNDSCIFQAHKAATEYKPENIRDRDDITNKIIVTIDPPDAKDFDDAISLERDANGNWLLGVHIADVTFFVPPGTPLDKEAKERGNSIYLPGRVIPMLPEMLSNGVCSLQPDQLRLVKSAYIAYDNDGNVVNRDYRNSIIRSTQRLTYQQVDRFLKGHTKDIKPEVMPLLNDMNTLARLIEKRRDRQGMLHLDLPETELVFDEAGRVIDGQPADNSYPHTIIEMFMVEANEAVATVLDRNNIPVMRRVHPDPDAFTMRNLAELVRSLGLSLPRLPDRASLQQLLNSVKGTDSSLAINLVVLRSMEKAQYSPLHIGHYALASELYGHFTSPIRRYADLLVHRALDCYLRGDLEAGHDWMPDNQQLADIGRHITFTEERADDAERELKAVLILQMLADKVGQELDCVVTGLTNFGIFVQSRKLGIEGLVQLADLGPDQWQYNPKHGSIVGRHSGRIVCLGQPMKVRIVSVNVAARQLNVTPVMAVLPASTRPLVGRGGEGGIHPRREQLIPKAKGKRAKHGGGRFAVRRKQKRGKRRR
ncbi:MAG: ribonuclease R [Sedimentisphaerales bacterium]|jgi:ribonuclease R